MEKVLSPGNQLPPYNLIHQIINYVRKPFGSRSPDFNDLWIPTRYSKTKFVNVVHRASSFLKKAFLCKAKGQIIISFSRLLNPNFEILRKLSPLQKLSLSCSICPPIHSLVKVTKPAFRHSYPAQRSIRALAHQSHTGYFHVDFPNSRINHIFAAILRNGVVQGYKSFILEFGHNLKLAILSLEVQKRTILGHLTRIATLDYQPHFT